jgi:ribosomal protein L37E
MWEGAKVDTGNRKSSYWWNWPDRTWHWRICDRCGTSRFWSRDRFCKSCGSELRASDLPLTRWHWVESWLTLALSLWVILAVVLGAGSETEKGFSVTGMIVIATLILAAGALVLIWRRTPKWPSGARKDEGPK